MSERCFNYITKRKIGSPTIFTVICPRTGEEGTCLNAGELDGKLDDFGCNSVTPGQKLACKEARKKAI